MYNTLYFMLIYFHLIFQISLLDFCHLTFPTTLKCLRLIGYDLTTTLAEKKTESGKRKGKKKAQRLKKKKNEKKQQLPSYLKTH